MEKGKGKGKGKGKRKKGLKRKWHRTTYTTDQSPNEGCKKWSLNLQLFSLRNRNEVTGNPNGGL